jgi:hypothetical protein
VSYRQACTPFGGANPPGTGDDRRARDALRNQRRGDARQVDPRLAVDNPGRSGSDSPVRGATFSREVDAVNTAAEREVVSTPHQPRALSPGWLNSAGIRRRAREPRAGVEAGVAPGPAGGSCRASPAWRLKTKPDAVADLEDEGRRHDARGSVVVHGGGAERHLVGELLWIAVDAEDVHGPRSTRSSRRPRREASAAVAGTRRVPGDPP